MKYTHALLFSLLLPLLAAGARAEEDDGLGCIRGDCENGQGTLVRDTELGRTVYRGGFRNGEYHGFGRLHWEDQRWNYKGYFRNGKRHGRGTFWDRENNVYIGQWANDRRNGQGSQFFAVEGWREDRYTENWLRDNTENYSGGFRNDVFYGEGTYRWKDGTRYVGGWVANKKHGDGYFDYGHGHIARKKYEFDERVFDF